MLWVSVDEMQRNLLDYLERVEKGETLVIVQASKPVAEVKPIGADTTILRPFGLCAGEFRVPNDFDAPLPDNLLDEAVFNSPCPSATDNGNEQ